MTIPPPSKNEIPPKMVDRYRKLQAIADNDGAAPNERAIAESFLLKLRGRYPTIAHAVEVIDRREQRRARAAGVAWHPPEPTQEEWEELIPDFLQRVGGLVGIDVVSRADGLFHWALNELKEASQAAIESAYDRGQNINTGDLMTLQEQLEEQMGVEIADDEADDGEELLIVTLEIPVQLWDKIRGQKNGAKSFLGAIKKAEDEGEEGDAN